MLTNEQYNQLFGDTQQQPSPNKPKQPQQQAAAKPKPAAQPAAQSAEPAPALRPKRQTPGSVSYVPAVAGLILAGEVIRAGSHVRCRSLVLGRGRSCLSSTPHPS